MAGKNADLTLGRRYEDRLDVRLDEQAPRGDHLQVEGRAPAVAHSALNSSVRLATSSMSPAM